MSSSITIQFHYHAATIKLNAHFLKFYLILQCRIANFIFNNKKVEEFNIQLIQNNIFMQYMLTSISSFRCFNRG